MIKGLQGVAYKGSGCVLVAEMSSEGSLATDNYTNSKCDHTLPIIHH